MDAAGDACAVKGVFRCSSTGVVVDVINCCCCEKSLAHLWGTDNIIHNKAPDDPICDVECQLHEAVIGHTHPQMEECVNQVPLAIDGVDF